MYISHNLTAELSNAWFLWHFPQNPFPERRAIFQIQEVSFFLGNLDWAMNFKWESRNSLKVEPKSFLFWEHFLLTL